MDMKVLFVFLTLVFLSCSNEMNFSNIEENKSLVEQVKARKIPKKDLLIYIEKSKKMFSVFYKEELLITYPCVLGFEPKGDKMQEGDGKTPEGKFGIRAMYPHKSWSFFIWIDYPTEDSWRRFNKRKANEEIGKAAKIGGEIGIHGVPSGSDELIDLKSNWTLGCISLKTKDITDLYNSISKETKIIIVK
jgi:murein L,D-transpeptidase YafK